MKQHCILPLIIYSTGVKGSKRSPVLIQLFKDIKALKKNVFKELRIKI